MNAAIIAIIIVIAVSLVSIFAFSVFTSKKQTAQTTSTSSQATTQTVTTTTLTSGSSTTFPSNAVPLSNSAYDQAANFLDNELTSALSKINTSDIENGLLH